MIEEVKYLLGRVDLSTDLSDVDPELWTTRLESVKRHVITAGVLSRYLLVDELLNDVVCREFFPREIPYPKLWRRKKFQAFNYYILERIFLVQKADFARERIKITSKIYNDLMALNQLRNALAHSFFPENRRVKPIWKGDDIFSRVGFDRFWEDMNGLSDFFLRRMMRAHHPRRAGSRITSRSQPRPKGGAANSEK